MKKLITLAILSMFFILSACASDPQGISSPDNTSIPDEDFKEQVATVVALTLTPISTQTTQISSIDGSGQPVSSTAQKTYSGSNLGIQFRYPENWYLQEFTDSQSPSVLVTSFDPANPPHKLEWNDQTISMHMQLLPAGTIPQNLEAWVEAAKQEAGAAQLSIFAEESFLIAERPAYHLTLVSGSGGIIHQVLIILNGRYYEIDIEGNFDTGKMVLATMDVLEPAVIKPADSDSPAAGICAEAQGDEVSILLGYDQSGMPLAGRCIVLNPKQRIKLVNQSDKPYVLKLADFEINLMVGDEILLDKPVGEYLAAGVHFIPMAPELWVKTTDDLPE